MTRRRAATASKASTTRAKSAVRFCAVSAGGRDVVRLALRTGSTVNLAAAQRYWLAMCTAWTPTRPHASSESRRRNKAPVRRTSCVAIADST